MKYLVIAVLFIGLAIWNYHYKSSLDQYFEEFNANSAQIKDIKDDILKLNYTIQESVLFQFYNNDKINEEYKMTMLLIDDLKNNLTQHPRTIEELTKLQEMMRSKYEVIKDLYISNAKVKNSITYLSSQLYKLEEFDKEYTHLVVELVNYFFQVKNSLDFSHIQNKELFDSILAYSFEDKKKQQFQNMLKIHTVLLLDEFPNYILYIDQATTSKEIEQTQKAFKTFLSESEELRFGFDVQIFFIVFASFISLGVILYLLLHSEKEKTKIIKLQEEFKQSIKTDVLTKLPNRLAYYRDARNKNRQFHLMLIDMIEFRNINSIFGMEVGDYLLVKVASLLSEFTSEKKNTRLYRIGSDEFAIVYESRDDDYLLSEAKSVLDLVENSPIYYNEIKIPVSVNIGISDTSPHLLHAQLCIKELHNTFGEKIKVYNEQMNDLEKIKENISMVQRIKEAIEEDRVVPYFQPIVDAKSGEVKKYESLVRIEEDSEALSPYFFLDIAKKVKLYSAISQTMMEKSIKMSREKDIDITINISIEDVLESRNSHFICSLLEQNRDVAEKITFEIIESEEIESYELLMEFIKVVKSYGCKIAIDDFGSGYSNFDYLFNFDVD
ncbi:MAG: EAL domain-containing protein, partial [Campylobacterales bacterium]